MGTGEEHRAAICWKETTFEELGVDERRVLAVEWGGKERIAVAHDRERSRAVVNAVPKF
jgi:hypothetical protein